jgi:hypothetical protein
MLVWSVIAKLFIYIIQVWSLHAFTFFFIKQCSPQVRRNLGGMNGRSGSHIVRASICVREASRKGAQATFSQCSISVGVDQEIAGPDISLQRINIVPKEGFLSYIFTKIFNVLVIHSCWLKPSSRPEAKTSSGL